jgi:signal transduction histidine kinase
VKLRLLKPWQLIRASLPLKVLLVLVLGGAAMNVVVMKGYDWARRMEAQHSGTSLARDYALSLLPSLGDPPDLAKARALAKDGMWSLRFQADDGSAWTTQDDVLTVNQAQDWGEGLGWGWHQNFFFIVVPRRGGRLVFQHFLPEHEVPPSIGVWLAVGLFGVLALVWLALRWLLRPVDWLNQGMGRVADGDLGHRIPARDGDELGRLAMQFNAMTTQVQLMLEERRQLLLDVSHELRTPLTRLKLGLENLVEGEERSSLAEDVSALELLVDELLEGARLGHGRAQLNVENLDLAALVRDGADQFLGRPPGLSLSVPPHLSCKGDSLRLQRLVLNLLSNAFTHGQPARGPVGVRLEQRSSQAVITVEDQGPGVPVEALARLFVPFFRLDSSRTRSTGGVGLGLHLCQRVARAHGGELTAAIGKDGGLCMTVVLPLA